MKREVDNVKRMHRFAGAPVASHDAEKQALRDKLLSDTLAYLADGKQIEKVPFGVIGVEKMQFMQSHINKERHVYVAGKKGSMK